MLRERDVLAFAVEQVPRISRAQSMDALSSQALVAGYRAAIVAAERLPRFFPLFMTAAGTVTPAKVLVLGAGVAGLQAIATARRLGAVVEAYDVRPASADEVRSMGATFVDLGLEALEGTGGYAREMAEERAERQRELLTPYVADCDVVITTAAVPGRPAPAAGDRRDGRDDASRARCWSTSPPRAAATASCRSQAWTSTTAGCSCTACRTRRRRCRCTPASSTPRNLVNLLLLMTTDGAGRPRLRRRGRRLPRCVTRKDRR